MPKGYELYKAQGGGGVPYYLASPDLSLPPEFLAAPGQDYFTFPAQQMGGGGLFSDDLFSDDLMREFLERQMRGAGSSSQSTVVMPPVLELLQEMRMRRQAEAEQAGIIAELMSANLPRGQTYYPGFEPQGLADVLLGIITGKGAEAAGILPEDQRRVRRTDIPIPEGQPPVGDEFSEASALARAILDAIRVIQTGQSSSGGI